MSPLRWTSKSIRALTAALNVSLTLSQRNQTGRDVR